LRTWELGAGWWPLQVCPLHWPAVGWIDEWGPRTEAAKGRTQRYLFSHLPAESDFQRVFCQNVWLGWAGLGWAGPGWHRKVLLNCLEALSTPGRNFNPSRKRVCRQYRGTQLCAGEWPNTWQQLSEALSQPKRVDSPIATLVIGCGGSKAPVFSISIRTPGQKQAGEPLYTST
jgi:hypothetical protein